MRDCVSLLRRSGVVDESPEKGANRINRAAGPSDSNGMFRWSRRIITIFSFLLLGQSIALWARSWVLIDFVHHQNVQRSSSKLVHNHRMLTSHAGKISLMTKRTAWVLPNPQITEAEIATIRQGFSHDRVAGLTTLTFGMEERLQDTISGTFGMKQRPKFGFGGEKIATTSNGWTADGRIIVFPWAVPTLLFAILPCISIVRFMASRRRIGRLKALNWNGIQTRKLAA
jgi:hypothetical protein